MPKSSSPSRSSRKSPNARGLKPEANPIPRCNAGVPIDKRHEAAGVGVDADDRLAAERLDVRDPALVGPEQAVAIAPRPHVLGADADEAAVTG